jgi:hypothetical protein
MWLVRAHDRWFWVEENYFGKRTEGPRLKPRRTPAVMVGCTEPATAVLNTVMLRVGKGVKEKLKFLIDTGSQLSLCKYASIKEGSVYDSKRVVSVRGISSCTEKTLGGIEMGLSTENYERTHIFHIARDGIRIPYDGILGQDFFISNRARIDYKKIEIIMGNARLKFDEKILSDEQVNEISVVLKARCETVVKGHINSEELKVGLISKTELLPEIVMAETLIVVREGGCLTSILNMTDEGVGVSLPRVDLEKCEIETNTIQVDTFIAKGAVTREARLRELRKIIRTDHLNDQEKRAIMNICEHYTRGADSNLFPDVVGRNR